MEKTEIFRAHDSAPYAERWGLPFIHFISKAMYDSDLVDCERGER